MPPTQMIRFRRRSRIRPRDRCPGCSGKLWKFAGAPRGGLGGCLGVLWGCLGGTLGGPGGPLGVSGGFLGVPGRSLGVPGTSSGVLWVSLGGPGASVEVPGRLPKMSVFFFLGGEFAYGISYNCLFRNWAILWRWSVVYVLSCLLSFFEACVLRNSEVNMV